MASGARGRRSATLDAITWLPALAAASCCVAIAWWAGSSSPVVGGFSDSVDYLVLADFFRGHFTGEVTGSSAKYFGISRFPPLYPLTLAMSGASVAEPARAYYVTAVQIAMALLAIGWWVRQQLRSTAAASLLVTAIALGPGFLLIGLNPVSEPLFMALLFACLALAARLQAGRGSLWVFAALLSLLPLVRTAGVALLLAAVPWSWFLRSDRRRWLAAVVLMWLPIAAWMAYRHLLPIQIDYSQQVSLARLLETFGGWSGWLLGQWPRMGSSFAELIDPEHRAPALALVAVLLLAALPAAWRRLRARALDTWFLPIYVGLVFVWPFPAEQPRLLLVCLPIVVVYAAETLAALARRVVARDGIAVTAAALFVAVAMVGVGASALTRFAHRLALPVDAELARHRATPPFFLQPTDWEARNWLELRERFMATIAELAEVVPQDDCVYSNSPAIVWLAAGTRVAIKPLPDGVSTAEQATEKFRDCDYFLVSVITSRQFGHPPLYPTQLISSWTEPVLVSEMDFGTGKRQPAVALLHKRDPAAGTEHR